MKYEIFMDKPKKVGTRSVHCKTQNSIQRNQRSN